MSAVQQPPPATGTTTPAPTPVPTPAPDPSPVRYSADDELNKLLGDLFAKQKQDDLDTRAMLQANQDRLARVFDRKNGVSELPPQVQQELLPLLAQCPQIVPHVTLFTKSLIQTMAAAAGAQLTKTLQALSGQVPPSAAPPTVT
jgi:hypothetical protein